MTTDNETEQSIEVSVDSIGQQLQDARNKKGYSVEYVAGKLHLRGQILSLIEDNDFDKLPQTVFIKGYIRAYAKCVDLEAEPLIEQYDSNYAIHKPTQEAYLWQKRKDVNHGVNLVKWFTVLSLSAVIISVGIWWKNGKVSQDTTAEMSAQLNQKQIDKQQQLTDLNKMSTIIKLPDQESGRVG
ncbi:helix-turn-helix domain-containing protein [Legionella sp. W05-934-2]|jgi:cytoskeletal protein RodZ|uniref:helix-turn-helix domain-containing protein n=1 Tax=Legionella sp. W05-934-2 TaxID=1198649 RepID=UPI0034625866